MADPVGFAIPELACRSLTRQLLICIAAFIFVANFSLAEDMFLTIDTKKPVALTSDKFLSYTIDPLIVFAGNLLTENPEKSINMAKALSPAYLRIGGPRSNSYTFERPNRSQEDADSDYTITESKWIDVHRWAENAGLEILTSIAPQRSENGGQDPYWDTRNAMELISFSDHMGFNMSWQLGYECQTRCDRSGINMGKDVKRLRNMLNAFSRYSESTITGPDVVAYRTKQQQQYLLEYLSLVGNSLSAITWHPNFSGITLDADGVSMHQDNLASEKDALSKVIGRFMWKRPLWLAESRPELCKNQFLGALLWTRRLGNSAKLGVQVLMRQPEGSNLLRPTPDYWVSVLHKMLVSREVLDAKVNASNRSHVHFYCHCTRPSTKYEKGSLTIFGINLMPTKVFVHLKGLRVRTVHKYILLPGFDAENRMFSETVLLNNKPLNLLNNQELPEIKPSVSNKDEGVSLKLPSGGIGFWVLPDLKIKVCGGLEDDTGEKMLLQKLAERLEESEYEEDSSDYGGEEIAEEDVMENPSQEMREKIAVYKRQLSEYESRFKEIESMSSEETKEKQNTEKALIEALKLISNLEKAVDRLEEPEQANESMPNSNSEDTENGEDLEITEIKDLNEEYLKKLLRSEKNDGKTVPTRIEDRLQAIYQRLTEERGKREKNVLATSPIQDPFATTEELTQTTEELVPASETTETTLLRKRRQSEKKIGSDLLGLRNEESNRRRGFEQFRERLQERKNRRDDSDEDAFCGFQYRKPEEDFPQGDVYFGASNLPDESLYNVHAIDKSPNYNGYLQQSRKTERWNVPWDQDGNHRVGSDEFHPKIEDAPAQFFESPVYFQAPKVAFEPIRDLEEHKELGEAELAVSPKLTDGFNGRQDETPTVRKIVQQRYFDDYDDQRTRNQEIIQYYATPEAPHEEYVDYMDIASMTNVQGLAKSYDNRSNFRSKPPTDCDENPTILKKRISDFVPVHGTDFHAGRFARPSVTWLDQPVVQSRRAKRSLKDPNDVLDREMIFEDDNNLKDCNCRVTRGLSPQEKFDNPEALEGLTRPRIVKRDGDRKITDYNNCSKSCKCQKRSNSMSNQGQVYWKRSKRDLGLEVPEIVGTIVPEMDMDMQPQKIETSTLKFQVTQSNEKTTRGNNEKSIRKETTENAVEKPQPKEMREGREEKKSLKIDVPATGEIEKLVVKKRQNDERKSSTRTFEDLPATVQLSLETTKLPENQFFRVPRENAGTKFAKTTEKAKYNPDQSLDPVADADGTLFEGATKTIEPRSVETSRAEEAHKRPAATVKDTGTASVETGQTTKEDGKKEARATRREKLKESILKNRAVSKNLDDKVKSANEKDKTSEENHPTSADQIVKQSKLMTEAPATSLDNKKVLKLPVPAKTAVKVPADPLGYGDVPEETKNPKVAALVPETLSKSGKTVRTSKSTVDRATSAARLKLSKTATTSVALSRASLDGKRTLNSDRITFPTPRLATTPSDTKKMTPLLKATASTIAIPRTTPVRKTLLRKAKPTAPSPKTSKTSFANEKLLKSPKIADKTSPLVKSTKPKVNARKKIISPKVGLKKADDAENALRKSTTGEQLEKLKERLREKREQLINDYYEKIVDVIANDKDLGPVVGKKKLEKRSIGGIDDIKIFSQTELEDILQPAKNFDNHKIRKRHDEPRKESLNTLPIDDKNRIVSSGGNSAEILDFVELEKSLLHTSSSLEQDNRNNILNDESEYPLLDDNQEHQNRSNIDAKMEEHNEELEKNATSDKNLLEKSGAVPTKLKDDIFKIVVESDGYMAVPLDLLEYNIADEMENKYQRTSANTLYEQYDKPKYERLATAKPKIMAENASKKRFLSMDSRVPEAGKSSEQAIELEEKDSVPIGVASMNGNDFKEASSKYELLMVVPVDATKNHRPRRDLTNELISQQDPENEKLSKAMEMIAIKPNIKTEEENDKKYEIMEDENAFMKRNQLEHSDNMGLDDIFINYEIDSNVLDRENQDFSRERSERILDHHAVDQMVRSGPKIDSNDRKNGVKDEEGLPDLLEQTIPKLANTVNSGLEKAQHLSESFEKLIENELMNEDPEIEREKTKLEKNMTDESPISNDVFSTMYMTVRRFFDLVTGIVHIIRTN